MPSFFKLALKAIMFILIFCALLGACMFSAAGTFAYERAWAILSSFCLPSLFISFYFLKKDHHLIQLRINPVANCKTQKIIQSLIVVLFFVGLLVLPGLDYRFSHSYFIPLWISVLANVMIVLGFAVFFCVFKTNSSISNTIEIGKNQSLVTTGPYAIIRHPMYFGAMLIILSLPPALGSLWSFIPAILICALIILHLKNEEKMLRTELAGYAAYAEKVPFRIIPFVF